MPKQEHHTHFWAVRLRSQDYFHYTRLVREGTIDPHLFCSEVRDYIAAELSRFESAIRTPEYQAHKRDTAFLMALIKKRNQHRVGP